MFDQIAVIIRAVRERAEAAEALLGLVHAFAPHARISWHEPGRTVPESYADALTLGSDRPYVLQLEDDIALSPRFAEDASRLVHEAFSVDRVALLSLYSGRRVKAGEALPAEPTLEVLPGSRFLMAQAIVMRSTEVPAHNEFMLRFTEDRPYATDTATAAWLASKRLRYARAWPSIVQHLDVPSMSGHRPHPNRRSQSFDAAYGDG